MPSLAILVVDDEPNIRKTLTIALEAEGHRVTAVSNFQDALAEACRRFFDVALVDLRLGTASGLELIPALTHPLSLAKDSGNHRLCLHRHGRRGHAPGRLRLPAQAVYPRPGCCS